MGARNYSAIARRTTLTAGATNVATTINVADTTGFPGTPFALVIDRGTASEEIVLCTGISGLALTVTRGYNGTSAVAHNAAAEVAHAAIALDLQEAGDHVAATSNVHGVTGSLVGTTASQTLDNKTFVSSDGTTHSALVAKAAVGQTFKVIDVQSSAGTSVAGFDTAGRVITPGVDGSNTSTFSAGNASTKPLIAKGAASQTANLFEAQDSSAVVQASISPAGVVTAKGVTNTGTLANTGPLNNTGALTNSGATALTGTAAGTQVLIVKAAASQTANIEEWQNNAGVAVASIDASGNITAPNLTNAWTAYTPTWGAVTTNPTIGNGSVTGAFRQFGKTVHWRAKVIFGTTTTFGSGGYTITLPVNAIADRTFSFLGILDRSIGGGGSRYEIMGLHPNGAALNTISLYFQTGTNSIINNFGPTLPVTLTASTGDYFIISGTYEAA